MLESAAFWLAYYPHHWWHAGEEPPRSGMRHQYLCPYGPFLARDGRYVNVVVASDAEWPRFCGAVDHPEWAQDPRFATVAARRRARVELDGLVEETIAAAPASVWLQRLTDAGLPCGLVRSIGEVVEHPQLRAREAIVEADSPVGPLPLIRFALAPAARTRLPDLGEDTDAVLDGLGYGAEEIAQLRREGVI
jgi:itaconate CoA-transferase